jgi:Zn ribbon nucleic-acid-binding protein
MFNADIVDNIYYVECVHCGAHGPISRSKIEAVDRWNEGNGTNYTTSMDCS